MKNRNLLVAICLLGIYALSPTQSFGQEPMEILKQMDKIFFAPDDQKATMKMVLTDRNGNERIREAQLWQKGTDKRLFRFTAPASEAGIAFLSLPDEVMYIYMPAFGRERRIASHVKNQSFAGTDFTYEDMETREYAKSFTASILRKQEETITLELIPRPEIRSDYSKIVMDINQKNFFPLRSEHYDRLGNLIKRASYTWKKQGSYWYPHEIVMTDLRRNHSTSMTLTSLEFNTGLSDQLFTVRNLTGF